MRLVLALLLAAPLVCGCGPRLDKAAGSSPDEHWDARSAPSIFAYKQLRYEEIAQASATHGQLATRPWEDDYWPFLKKNMARRYLSERTFDDADEQIDNAKDHSDNVMLSPAEKYDLVTGDDNFVLTRESWWQYTSHKKQYHDDDNAWSWMGICGGWTPAAMREKAPASSVLVKGPTGKEVLFFEGDIRGLLSKSYDLNQTSQGRSTMGSRCDEKAYQVQRDAAGRPVDGYFEDTKDNFYIVSDFWAPQGALEVTTDPTTMADLKWLVTSEQGVSMLEGEHSVFVYGDRDKALADIAASQIGQHASSGAPRLVRLVKACRAINPGAFHLSLVQGYSDVAKDKQGFIIQVTRVGEIWNQPLFGFTSTLGTPVPVGADNPASAHFRSPEAAYLVPVKTKVAYIGETGQVMMHYDDLRDAKIDWSNFDNGGNVYVVREFDYTLELDTSGYVVGGEWAEQTGDLAPAPSFIWQPLGDITDTAMGGQASILKASLIRKIRDCSFDSHKEPVMVTTKFGTQQIYATHCQL